MSSPSQTRALQNYRKRLASRGMTRFEVLGLSKDRELIRSLAKRLAEDSHEAAEIRTALHCKVAEQPQKKGSIVAALRNSPLVGADLDLTRQKTSGRRVDL